MVMPCLIAHRGYAQRYPENTALAIEQALHCGVRALEFDVQFTADGVPVLLHDLNLKRTGGVDQNITEIPVNHLTMIEVNETVRFGDAYIGTRIPTLAEIVALLRAWPGVTVFVELKEESLQAFGIENTVRTVMAVLKPIHEQAVIISYDQLAVRCARAMGARRIGWILRAWDNVQQIQASELAPDVLFCNYTKLPAAPTPLWRGPWEWALYEITNPELAIMLARRGVRYIETMAVGEMLRYPLLREQGDITHATV